MFKKTKKIIIFSILFVACFAVANFVLAADPNTLLFGGLQNEVGNAIGLPQAQDPRIIAANIIRVALGFLGLVAVGIVIYAGWLWMTAGGDAKKVDKAKKVLLGALIGLLLIIASFGIVTFILGKILESVGGGGGPCVDNSTRNCGCSGTQTCAGGVWDVCLGSTCGGSGSFYVTNAMPAGNTVMNAKVRYYFSNNVDKLTVDDTTLTVVDSSGSSVSGNYITNGKRVEFVPDGACPPNSCGAINCFSANDNITVTATNGILDINGTALTCTINYPCVINFNTNNVVDCNKPSVSLLYDTQVCLDTINDLGSSAFDDSGISQVEFTDSNGGSAFTSPTIIACLGPGPCGQLPPGPAWDVAPGNVTWRPTSPTYSAGTNYTITVTADDIDANQAMANKTFKLWPDHCCSGVQDGDETGVDCGGSCAGCQGAACAIDKVGAPDSSCSDTLCASGFCTPIGSNQASCAAAGYDASVASCCLCQNKPRIDWLSPVDASNIPNGAPGNLITIGGINFGATAGQVIFGGIDTDGDSNIFGDADDKIASFPSALNPDCTNNWQDNQIIAVVPDLPVADGPIKVITSANYEDATNDSYGPVINDFYVNTTVRPGLCLANPGSGYFGNPFNLQGINFNGASQTVKLGNTTNNISADNINFLSNISVDAAIPNIKPGNNTVFVEVDAENSNYLLFSVLANPANAPVIDYIDPNPGPPGQYVTIFGSNFKSYKLGASLVQFKSISLGTVYNADGLDFPAECKDSWWHDTYIAVKVPPAIADFGDYEVTVTNSDSNTSNAEIFNVFNDTPGPGLCKLDPHNGPVGQAVKAYGDNFGNSQGSGFVRFYNNKLGNITSWANKKIEVNVPISAETGPVRAANDSGKLSNSLPFTVGSCTNDSQCDVGAGEVCCKKGTYWEGTCRPAADCNAGGPTACAYGWTFTTAPPTVIPPTCAGYSSAGACSAANMCPNSPGQCQTKQSVSVGDCSDSDCGSKYITECALGGNGCTYNSSSNKCEINGYICNETNKAILSPYTAKCRSVGGKNVWQIDIKGSCPAGSYKDINGWCTAGSVGSPGLCDPTPCPSKFTCSKADDGQCISLSGLCPAGSKCDLTVNQCKTTDICECCCRVANSEQDCCSGLTCQAGGCGSDPINYGLCTGCLVKINGSPDQTASDSACDCYGNNTKYCDLSDLLNYPTGVCRDKKMCDSDPYNGAGVCDPDSNLCSSGEYCDPGTCFCETAPPCDSNTNSSACDPDASLCPAATFSWACDPISCLCQPKYCDSDPFTAGCTQDPTACLATEYCDSTSCICKPLTSGGGPGELCILLTAPTCTVGVTSCITDYSCLSDSSNADCRCCCTPTHVNAAGLTCSADKSPCAGANRGLYCGCTSDSQCVDTINIGCGFDTCCRNRPIVTDVSPLDGATNICRNSLISATFDQLMDISSFTGNVIVVGDYGSGFCPAGTQYILAQGQKEKGFFARLFQKIASPFKRLLTPFFPHAWALANNFCAIKGTTAGFHNPDNTTTLTFSPSSLLDANRKHYIIIKGDSNLSDGKKEGVESIYDVTMADSWIDLNGDAVVNDNDRTLNGVKFYGYIWSFTTMPEQAPNNGVCKISQIKVIPNSYLFQTTADDLNENDTDENNDSFDTARDRDKVFIAQAVTSSGQFLSEIAGVYEWAWGWNLGNTAVISFDSQNPYPADSDKELIEAQSGITDGSSVITVSADISGSAEDPGGESYQGQAQVWVFVCENPWPPVDPITGLWAPWSDIVQGMNCLPNTGACFPTNYELYYCRDTAGIGTADDLPAILATSTIIRGSSTTENLLKEFYFFREVAPSTAGGISLVLTDQTTTPDGKVFASWNPVAGANGYKVYYGTQSGSYSNYQDVGGANSLLINNLTVGQTYYFTVTAYYVSGAESGYSPEVSITPEDKTPPAAPVGKASLVCGGEAFLSWNPNTDDAAGYKVYYGATSDYGGVEDVKTAVEATLTGLSNATYYFAITAYDAYNNESVHSPIKTFTFPDCGSLVSYWRFDESSGNIIYDSIGSNDGTLNGAISVNGKSGQAYEFSGVDFIELPNLNLGTEYTISFWATGNTLPVVMMGNDCSTVINYKLDGSFEKIYHYIGSSNQVNFIHKIQDSNTWYHYVIARSDISDEVSLYIDGSSVDPPKSASGLGGNDFIIRYIGGCNGGNWIGKIDEVIIFNRALSSNEVNQLFSSY